ncbi:helix-turn-helix domain-containing protein [Emticicia sp. BO119]|uniref:helix-turn-helix domain-containing protein n=1 Tax=Emticicia sp. BO119 TaxID=2757768 RepID=UPI0015F0831C|nr:helix-turn-helix domain-containing protein [Emticicia sp. BO119]MBA4849779.1 MerR family transcriptional regulator [Emticicia sp. BO119]
MKLFYTTNEVAEILGVTASKIRFYEKKFRLRFERNGRDRKITKKDIDRLREIIEVKNAGTLTLKGTERKINKKTDLNKSKNALKTRLLTIRAFLQEALKEI